MNSRARSLVFIATALLLAGCFGRIPDQLDQGVDAKAFGLDGVRPALVVFGAAWCKPCKSEIPALNRAHLNFKDDLQIVNFLVEGAQKGVPAKTTDSLEYLSPRGVKPTYKVSLDPSWALFESLSPPQGHLIPTLVFVNRQQRVERIVQRSMEYESELLPALRDLVAGKSLKPKPVPQPDEGAVTKILNFAEWTSLPQNAPDGDLYNNVYSAWRHGLDDFAFLEDDMPFEEAAFSVVERADGSITTKSAVWVAFATGCKLTVYLNPDGSYERSEGICR